MKKFIGELIKNLAVSFVATIGLFAGIVVMGSGLADWIEEKTKKLFNR